MKLFYYVSVSQDKKQRTGFRARRGLGSAAGAAILLLCLGLSFPAGKRAHGWGAALNLGTGLEITRGPYLQVPIEGVDAMAVLWETNLPCRWRRRSRPAFTG